jgi:hypothetical protein
MALPNHLFALGRAIEACRHQAPLCRLTPDESYQLQGLGRAIGDQRPVKRAQVIHQFLDAHSVPLIASITNTDAMK